MPPLLVHRAERDSVEEHVLAATPLGTLGSQYPQVTVELSPGDTVLLMTDGFPELMNDAGSQLGYPAAMQAFAESARQATDADGVIEGLSERVRAWHGDAAPNDDVTFVVVRVA